MDVLGENVKDVSDPCQSEECHSYLNRSVLFLAKYSWIYRFKNTDIFDEEVLESIPDEWKVPLLNLSWDELNQVPYGFFKDEWPLSLKAFVEEAVNCHSQCFHHTTKDYDDKKIQMPVFIQKEMSKKKLVEVKHMSVLISDICRNFQCDVVLDIGSGLGYLDQALHHNYGLTIIGVDNVATRTQGAERRIQKGICKEHFHFSTFMVDSSNESFHHLQSLMNSVMQNNAQCMCGTTDKAASHHQQKTTNHGVVMVGLHSCGSLVNDMMKLFLRLPEVKAFICVGCCYHRMSVSDFPVSKVAKEALSSAKESFPEWSPCLCGFRLGCQDSRAHWAARSQEDHILHFKNVAYRGVFQAFLKKENLVWKRPKRRFSKLSITTSFDDYISSALGNNFSNSNKQIQIANALDVYQSKENLFPNIRIIALLQVLLQPIWEGIITIDRVAYLQENNIDAKIVTMCDELTTPRNLVIVGVR